MDRIRRYPWVALTLISLIVDVLAHFTGLTTVEAWVAIVVGGTVAISVSVGMVRDLLTGHWGIDILAVSAIVATLLVGEYLAALVVCLMITGGEALEDYASGRATRSLHALLERAPQVAHRVEADGSLTDIAVQEVAIGDTVLVRPAEVVPVDGVMVAGTDSAAAEFDLSSLTGESLPVTKYTGDEVLSGSLNGTTAVRLRATASAADSQYARILDLVRSAAESRAPMVRLADRYAVPFTVIAYAIGIAAWVVAGDPVRFAEVLVVATPCPLLIAAPVAFLGGMSRAAGEGVIVKNGGTIETLGIIKSAAFDKTGTLTYGKPQLISIQPMGMSEDELLRVAASAEQYSVHVLAAPICAAAEERGLKLAAAPDAQEVATKGITAHINGARVIVGNRKFVAEHAGEVAPAAIDAGQTAVYVSIDGRFAGALVLADAVRTNAGCTLAALDDLGVRERMMLTGDTGATATRVAQQTGITDVEAELLPEDKVRAVREAEPKPVMMVGDGVNDAPVLAVADVGVAMGARGSTAASETADVVIVKDDISKVAVAVAIGQNTLRVAKESILVGIVLSVVLMVVAAFGVIPAIVGALLQEVVDVVSILNALRSMKEGDAEVRVRARLATGIR
ncbi:heavy metal translocating P-type ATPase [Neoactinobaculum massilliense]|uniref:heavy metal translocating P-type ATPase n=1 Tax=Neoactinobaculum massilliense TaxID=2364794 RepID=UPI000F525375|nr:heavy metal translocating P-type ATPase [Neoactinobaculum massilliense]